MADAAVDLIRVEVVRGALAAVAEEIGMAVVRGAYSTMVKESGDVSGAIFDRRGRLVAQSATTMFAHVASLRACVIEVLKDYPVDTIRDGDLLFMNDPYRGGVHANDIAVFRPLVLDGEVKFFTGTLVHVADLGGMTPGGLPGTATDTFQEGVVLPPVFLGHDGVLDPTILKLVAANSRIPAMVIGDLKALVGGANMGARRLEELVHRFGYEELSEAVDFLIDYAERRSRLAVSRLPAGTFTGEGTIDDDGVDRDRSLRVRVAITTNTEGDLLVDFTGTDTQASGPVNASYAQATSAAVYGARVLIDDPDIPINEGAFSALRLVLPEGTLVNPRWPAAVNGRGITMSAIAEAMFEALSKQQPNRAVAASPSNHVMSISTHNPETGGIRVYTDNDYGGTGGRAGKDGVDATGSAFLAGRTFTVSVEGVEQEHPVMYDHFRLRPDSGGAGQWRGGLGTERTVRFLERGLASMRADKVKLPPKGFGGGADGAHSDWIKNLGQPTETRLNSKETNVPMQPGDTLTMRTGGGGGFGNPKDRAPDLVERDLVEGRITEETAESIYGAGKGSSRP